MIAIAPPHWDFCCCPDFRPSIAQAEGLHRVTPVSFAAVRSDGAVAPKAGVAQQSIAGSRATQNAGGLI